MNYVIVNHINDRRTIVQFGRFYTLFIYTLGEPRPQSQAALEAFLLHCGEHRTALCCLKVPSVFLTCCHGPALTSFDQR